LKRDLSSLHGFIQRSTHPCETISTTSSANLIHTSSPKKLFDYKYIATLFEIPKPHDDDNEENATGNNESANGIYFVPKCNKLIYSTTTKQICHGTI
jgi:hypothetical protein